MPVEHAALEQARGEIDKFAAVELFSICRCGIIQQVVPARQLHASDELTMWQGRCPAAGRVLLQERLMHIVQMVEGDDWRLKQRRTRHAIREIALRKLF